MFKTQIHTKFLILLLTSVVPFLFCSMAGGFSFSEYEASEARDSVFGQQKKNRELLDIACLGELKNQKIVLIIAEEQRSGSYLVSHDRHKLFYQEISNRLRKLGMQTFSPETISKQIAQREIQAILNNDSQAAMNAAGSLGASFFIRGLIATKEQMNPVVHIPEVFVSMSFSLTDARGRLISDAFISSDAFSGADILGTLLKLVGEDADRVVAKLYHDYCKSGIAVLKTKQRVKKVVKKQTDSPKLTVKKEQEHTVQTIIVSAEGLADPAAETYKRDKGLMIDALRADARRQAIEKAVGTFVDSTTLVENFTVINDRVLTHSKGLIKQIIKETSPWLGEDGLMHIMIKAEVFLTDIKNAVESMSENQRLTLIRESGNPTISVTISIRDASRSSTIPSERSAIAENILKEEFSQFGYRVWSEEYTSQLKGSFSQGRKRRQADFSVLGESKFKQTTVRLSASGITLNRHILTSWTVKCVNNHTGEEIYFNNQIPKRKSWDSEDEALADIGQLIGEEFSRDFFVDHLNRPSSIFQLELTGLPDYDTALLLKKELIGLRPILNVDLWDFSAGEFSIFEIDFAGSVGNFSQIVHNTVIKPLNAKLGSQAFKLMSRHGNVVRIAFSFEQESAVLQERLRNMPPSSLAGAAPERIIALIHNPETLKNVMEINPGFGQDHGSIPTSHSTGMIQDF